MLNATERQYGSLDCIVVDGGDSPEIAVVMCHGYGAPGSDLASLSASWIPLLGDDAGRFRFVFPAAPGTLEELGMPDGRAWWPLNMARLMQAFEANQFDELHEHTPPGIDEARAKLCETVALVKDEIAGESTPLVLGGFSQGAMLTMDAALRGTIAPPQVLVQFSGTVICEPLWTESMKRLENTRVYQAHGQVDQILPFTSAQKLHELLQQADVEVQFHPFVGPHTIDQASVFHTVEAMKSLV